mmetsp:Transcript_1994/g.4636  ORF Transcript_1994/g.4636 Transcript_1994/m.4636 type:complete len:206 (-) Transcript_1994:631-1248(-)
MRARLEHHRGPEGDGLGVTLIARVIRHRKHAKRQLPRLVVGGGVIGFLNAHHHCPNHRRRGACRRRVSDSVHHRLLFFLIYLPRHLHGVVPVDRRHFWGPGDGDTSLRDVFAVDVRREVRYGHERHGDFGGPMRRGSAWSKGDHHRLGRARMKMPNPRREGEVAAVLLGLGPLEAPVPRRLVLDGEGYLTRLTTHGPVVKPQLVV